MSEQVAVKDPFFDQKPERVWILISNVCEKGKFKVTLEFNGREMRMFHGYVDQNEGVVSKSYNLMWLFRTRDAEIDRLRLALTEIQFAYGEPNADDIVTTTAREALQYRPVQTVLVDPTMPPTEAKLVDPKTGKELVRIVNLGEEKPNAG